MNREDYFRDRIIALEAIRDSYLGLVEGDTSFGEEPLQDDSNENEVYGDIVEDGPQMGR